MRRVQLTPQLVAINRWNPLSHLNRGLATIIGALPPRMQLHDM